MDPDQTAPVCKIRCEKFARIFSRRQKHTTFSDAGFLSVLRVKDLVIILGQLSPVPIFSIKTYVVSTHKKRLVTAYVFYGK